MTRLSELELTDRRTDFEDPQAQKILRIKQGVVWLELTVVERVSS